MWNGFTDKPRVELPKWRDQCFENGEPSPKYRSIWALSFKGYCSSNLRWHRKTIPILNLVLKYGIQAIIHQ